MSYALSPEGLRKIDEFVTSVYQNYNAAVGSKFSVEPSVVQSIFKKPTLDGAWFLNLINPSVPVKELTGEKLGMGLTGLISSRKKTSIGNERQAKQFHSLDKEGFQLVKRNFDWGLAYEYIDKWRHLAGEMFAKFYGDLIAQAYVNETLLIGWNGTSIAEETDPVANPLGQDMNIGWFQKLRDHAPGQIIDDPVTIGATGDFKNLDSLINEMRFGQAEVFRENSANRALISSDLIGASTGRYYESSGDTPSEKSHLNNGRIIETFGGLQSLVPPFMPSKAVMVTPPKNISIYHQEGSWRRQILNEPKLDQFSDFNSVNEGFLLEENTAAMVFTNVSFLES